MILAAFTNNAADDPHAVDRIYKQYLQDLDHFNASVTVFEKLLHDSDQPGIKQLRAAFTDTRTAYKRIEFLVEFIDAGSASLINAPVLPKINASSRARLVVQPEGLQVIEELVYADDPFAERNAMLGHVEKLHRAIAYLRKISQNVTLVDRHIFEASRSELIRVMTLGISGFDSPVALRSMSESAAALEGVQAAISHYYPALLARRPELQQRIEQRFADAITMLRTNPDFDSFDRLAFIRNLADPLYGDLLEAHLAFNLETFEQTVGYNRAVRYGAASMFDRDFLNPYYYSEDISDHPRAELAELGRLLFFDPILSGDNQRACASCHRPDMAFTDGMARSVAFHGGQTVARNSPTLLNATFQTSMFLDARAESFEQQIDMVLLNGLEMNTSAEQVVDELRQSPEYIQLFARTFDVGESGALTYVNIKRALAAYMRTLVSLDSPFDRYMRQQSDHIDPAIHRGFNLFMGKAGCATCHFPPVFNGTVPPLYTDTEVEVLGTASTPDTVNATLDPDPGRYAVFRDDIHLHAFKTPTVRNVALTAPYMHNGTYATLEEIVDFYDHGGGAGMGLDVPTQTLPSDRLDLDAREKSDLVAFMKWLSDTSGTTTMPQSLPQFPNHPQLNRRQVAGQY
jgi:cytochrome c peroxidase